MWKYKEEYKLDKPETIGETDYTFDLDNYREWLEEQLTECRKQLSIANVVGQSEQLPDGYCKWCKKAPCERLNWSHPLEEDDE